MEEEESGEIKENNSKEIKINGEGHQEAHSEKKPKNKNLTEKIKTKTISFLKNKYNLVFLVILFLALLIRLKYIGQESLWNDAAVHLWFAIKAVKEPLFFLAANIYGEIMSQFKH